MDQIARAAKLAGDWWATRLNNEFGDKREAFAASVTKRVDDELRLMKTKQPYVFTECDYDPKGLMLNSLLDVFDPKVVLRSDNVLPTKHELLIFPEKLVPKEGYGNWTEEIVVSAE